MNKLERRWRKLDQIVTSKMFKALYRQAQLNGYPDNPAKYRAILMCRYENQSEPELTIIPTDYLKW